MTHPSQVGSEDTTPRHRCSARWEATQAQAPAPVAVPAPAAAAANNNNNNDVGEREDDWLGTLHNIVSFLVLFCIIYYYSSIERFLVIFTIVVMLIL